MREVSIDRRQGIVKVDGKEIPSLLLGMIQGSLGKLFVVKHYRGRKKKRKGIVVTRFPNMSGIVATKKQWLRKQLAVKEVVRGTQGEMVKVKGTYEQRRPCKFIWQKEEEIVDVRQKVEVWPLNKIFLLIIVLLGFNNAAKSQLQFGLKAGVNLANQVKTLAIPDGPSTEQDTKPFVGYQLGAFCKSKLHSRVLLSAEVNFSVIGSGMTLMTSDGKRYNAHEKLSYIELPLTIQYKPGKIYFGAGPSAGFKVFSKITNYGNRSYHIPYYRFIDAAGNLLAGYSVAEKLDVNIRYSYGFSNLYKEPGYAKAKNNFVNLSLLYTLQ